MSDPAAGVVEVTVIGASPPVAPWMLIVYSPSIGLTRAQDLHAVAARRQSPVQSITSLRPSGALPVAVATRLPLAS